MTRHRPWSRSLTVALAVALALAACTDEEPGPPPPGPTATSSPGDDGTPPADPAEPDVAIVLPDADEIQRELAVYERAIDRARAAFGGQLSGLREVHLDGASFRLGVLTLLGDQGTGLTCAIGAGARDVVAAAQQLPGQRFCVVDDRIDSVPDNVLAAWFRYEEAAYLLGFASASMLPADDPGGTLGFITPALDTRTEIERQAFTAGARVARPDVAIAIETLTDDDGEASLEDRAGRAAAALFDDREAGVVFLTAGVPAAPVLQVASERLRLVTGIGPPLSDGAPSGLEPFVLATVHTRLERGLTAVLSRVIEGWQGGVAPLGFADDALVLTPGGSVRWNEIREQVAELRGRVERGEVQLG